MSDTPVTGSMMMAGAGVGGGGGGGAGGADPREDTSSPKRKEIYTYEAAWDTYALTWSARRNKPFRLAAASFLKEYTNKVDVVQLNEESNQLERVCSFDHPYPATKIMFLPDFSTSRPDLLATTGDYLRLWEVGSGDDGGAPGARGGGGSGGVTMKACLNNNKKTDFCAPLTSFDWNADDPKLVATASIDTTCTIWDVNAETATTQLIAHDKEVYDVAFAKGQHVFSSVGADGSVRLFDLRNLEHSTIIYESVDNQPILRLGWNRQDPNYIATIMLDSPSIIIVDVRVPSVPVAILNNHNGPVNSIQWAPHSSCHLCSAADDSQALIWDVSALPKPVEDPILAYTAEGEIETLQWSSLQTDWIAIAFGKKLQILRV